VRPAFLGRRTSRATNLSSKLSVGRKDCAAHRTRRNTPMDQRGVQRKSANYAMFAGIWFFISGGFNVISGLAALTKKEYFANGDYLYNNLQAWGWAWLIIGVVGLLVGWLILSGSRAGRLAGIVMASIGMIVWFFSLGIQPFWAMVNLVVYGLIIYGLTVYGDVFE
jgi:hypothetical protein